MAIALPASWAQTPGTRDRSKLCNDVMRYVKLPDDPEAKAVAVDGINEAILTLNTRLWHWAVQTQDIALVADDGDYTLNASFKAPFHATFLDSNDKEVARVHWEDPKTFQRFFYDRTSSGAPNRYTVINAHKNGLVYLSKAPDSGHVATYPKLRIVYYKRIATLTDDAARLDAPSEVETFLTWSAKGYVASVYDPKMIHHAERKAASALRDLIRDDNESGHSDWSETNV